MSTNMVRYASADGGTVQGSHARFGYRIDLLIVIEQEDYGILSSVSGRAMQQRQHLIVAFAAFVIDIIRAPRFVSSSGSVPETHPQVRSRTPAGTSC